MPIIRVELLSGRNQQQKKEIADIFTRELARIAKCGIGDVQVLFDEVDKQNWAVGGVISETAAHAK